MGPEQLDAEAFTRSCASAQRHAGPTLERGNNECRPDTRSVRQSDRPPVRPRRRRPSGAPVRLHDGRHRSRAGDGRLAPGALPRQHAGSSGQRDAHAGSGLPEAPVHLPARRSRLRRGRHPPRRLLAAAAGGRWRRGPHGLAAVRSAARGSPRDRVRCARRRARRGRREVHASDARPRRARDARSGLHRGQRVRGRGRGLGGRGAGARDRRARAHVARQATAAVRRAAARRARRRAARRLCRARRGGSGEAQGEGHGRGGVHGAESLHEQRRPREREGPARTVRRHQDRGAGGALRGHGGRDGGPRRCGPAAPGNPAMDGGAMRAVVAAAALLSLLPPYGLSAQDSTRIAEAQAVLAQLVETYGVSGAEGPVREAVKRLLPSWAKSETDTAGNLWVRVGQGSPLVVVIAHLDEIGFRVTGIRDDGTLELETRGGFISSLFEGKPALVHTDKGIVPGVFIPRDSGFTRHTPPPLRVDVGAGSRAKAMARGVSPGQTVTMPKQYVRLSGTRATGRSFDDRVGATAQLIALRRLDRAVLKHQVIFIWSVREEIGLEGAAAAAAALGTTPRRVHAFDTFVSADSPIELPNFAVAPIGRGAVARALDNSSITPPAYVDSLVQIARARGVALQVGTTNGGNDGSEFTPYGVVDVPIGWPLRYSHSPAEVIDLKDVVSLADLIRAVAETW